MQLAFVSSYTRDTLVVLNVSDPNSLTQVGYVTDSLKLNGAWSLAYDPWTKRAFVTATTAGAPIAPLPDPDQPTPLPS